MVASQKSWGSFFHKRRLLNQEKSSGLKQMVIFRGLKKFKPLLWMRKKIFEIRNLPVSVVYQAISCQAPLLLRPDLHRASTARHTRLSVLMTGLVIIRNGQKHRIKVWGKRNRKAHMQVMKIKEHIWIQELPMSSMLWIADCCGVCHSLKAVLPQWTWPSRDPWGIC